MKRNPNIVIFSSGVSQSKGLTDSIKKALEERGCVCCCWRELFSSSLHKDSIALLPMLIKKIPTFDFALLICEGHDTTLIMRDGVSIETNTMRDNVLFEIGLCSVALGPDRTILLADRSVRLPEDLTGIDGKVALHEVFLSENEDAVSYDAVADKIVDYIASHDKVFSPVVVGAAASTASGYVTNFIFRCLERVYCGFRDKDTQETIVPEKGKLDMEIYIPFEFGRDTSAAARRKQSELRTGIIETARRRQIEFNYTVQGDRIIIRDYPTTLVTSYNTACTILRISADDEADPAAQTRFVAKELDLFESALYSLLTQEHFEKYITYYYENGEVPEWLDIEAVKELISDRLRICRENY